MKNIKYIEYRNIFKGVSDYFFMTKRLTDLVKAFNPTDYEREDRSMRYVGEIIRAGDEETFLGAVRDLDVFPEAAYLNNSRARVARRVYLRLHEKDK